MSFRKLKAVKINTLLFPSILYTQLGWNMHPWTRDIIEV